MITQGNSSSAVLGRGDGGGRKTVKKFDDAKGLSITSLLDILTIILVFLIKNASVEMEQTFTKPPDMKLPSTVISESLIDDGIALVIKIYEGERGIVVGTENYPFGNPEGIMGDPNDPNSPSTRTLWEYLKLQHDDIKKNNPEATVPCVLVQADYNIPCKYITQLIWLSVAAEVDGTTAGFANIYFSSIQDENWKEKPAALAMQ